MSKEYLLNAEPLLIIASSPHPTSEKLLGSLREKGNAAELVETDIANCLNNLPAQRNVVIVSDQPQVLADHADRPGTLAVLINAEDCMTSAHDRWISVPSLDSLTPLFDGSLPDLMSLLRLDITETRQKQDAIKASFLDAVRSVGGLHVFGAGTIGRQVLQECRTSGLAVLGFIDNSPQRQGGHQDGLPIRNPADLDRTHDVVVVAAGNHAESITKQLRELGFQSVFNLSQFFYAVAAAGQPETGYLQDLYENRLSWIALALQLQDQTSRTVFNGLLQHRLTLDTWQLSAVKERNVTQWFDPQLLKPNREAVFVDGGAFDGDTAEAFRLFNGPAKCIHAFELDPEIAERAKVRLAPYSEVRVHSFGLSDRRTKIGFVGSGITNGRIDSADQSERHADVISIDDAVPEAVTYLKLDVEGAEYLAIAGAERQIRENSPTIGLAVYHRPSDPWLLTKQLTKLYKGYRYYMRHYTDVAFETVIYALPA